MRAAAATGPIPLRADTGFHNQALRARLAAKGVAYSIGARVTKRVAAASSFAQALTRAHQIAAQRLARANQVTRRLLLTAREH